MRKIRLVILGILILSGMLQSVWAESGRKLFEQSCLRCHGRGDLHVVAPVDKASMQWERFFQRKKHQRRYNVDLTPLIPEKDLRKILEYLIRHASDSDQPQVAGDR